MPDRPATFERVLIVVAMRAEAEPIGRALGLDGPSVSLHPNFPATLATARTRSIGMALVGADARFDVDSIGTQPAVTTTLHAIERFEPDLVISAGAAGGFEALGGHIGQVILADRCVYHDRRIAIPGWDDYGVGDYPVVDLGLSLDELGIEAGTVSTGNALDAPAEDLAAMATSGARAKEMEAAAVGWVCERMEVPFTALKAITDLVDHHEETAEQFDRNLAMAIERLAEALVAVVDAVTATAR